VRPAHHRIGKHAKYADHGQRQPEQAEEGEQGHVETRLDALLADDLLQGDGPAERLILVHLHYLLADCTQQEHRTALRAHSEQAAGGSNHRIGNIDCRTGHTAQTRVPGIGEDSDYGELRRPARRRNQRVAGPAQNIEPYATADRALTGAPQFGGRFVDHGHRVGMRHFLFGKSPAAR
jgi:hypothetical protein